jgi:hypothetical protein
MASAFCVYELLAENYGKHLANSNRSTPLSESRARNLNSLVFVVWQQYGRLWLLHHPTGSALRRRRGRLAVRLACLNGSGIHPTVVASTLELAALFTRVRRTSVLVSSPCCTRVPESHDLIVNHSFECCGTLDVFETIGREKRDKRTTKVCRGQEGRLLQMGV